MTKPLPKWIQLRYASLWKKFKNNEFSFDDAEKALKDKRAINVFFSDLKKAGWIEVSLDEKDSRKRQYRLKEPEPAFLEMEK